MNKFSKLFLSFLLSFLFIGIVSAGSCPEDNSDCYDDPSYYQTSNPNTWDYNDPKFDWNKVDFSRSELYNSQNFYDNLPVSSYNKLDYSKLDYSKVQIDYTQLDYSKVVWNKMPNDRIKEVPPESLDYSQLNPSQRKEMIPNQIALNFDNIEDLTNDVNVDAAEVAIADEFGVSTDLEGSVKISNGVLISSGEDLQDSLTLTNPSYKSGFVAVSPEGNIIFIPMEEDILFEPSNEDFFSFVPMEEKESFNLKVEGIDSLTTIRGNLRFENGEIFVPMENKAVINGVEILSKENYVNVYLDGREIEDSINPSISMDLEKREFKAQVRNDALFLTFQQENNFLNVQENDYLDVNLFSDVFLSFQNRESQNLIPSVEVLKLNSDASFYVQSGMTRFGFDEGEVYTDHFRSNFIEKLGHDEFYTSVPMVFEGVIDDSSRRIIISNYNEIGIIEEDGNNGLPRFEDLGKGSVSETIYFNYDYFTEERLIELKQEFPNLEFEMEDLVDKDSAIKYIYDSLHTLPEDIVENIKQIRILNPENFAKEAKIKFDSQGVQGWTNNQRIVTLGESRLTYSTLYHEGLHDLHFKLNNDMQSEYARQRKALENSDPVYDQLVTDYLEARHVKKEAIYELEEKYPTLGESEILGLVDVHTISEYTSLKAEIDRYHKKLEEEVKAESFQGIWENIAQYSYGGSSSNLKTEWSDGTNEPKDGLMRAYSSNNVYEDIATYVEEVRKNPSSYDSLITPEFEDKRYIQKLALLNNINQFDKSYSALPKGWLEKRMQTVGYNEDCIEDVVNGNGYKAECIN